MMFRRALAAVSAALTMLAATIAMASPAQAVGASHCTIVTGNLHYEPALTLLPKQTTMTIAGRGEGCVGISALASPEQPVGTSVSSMEITGTFTGTGSTLLSSYTGTATITWHLADGRTLVTPITATCVLGAAGICPFLGTVTSGPAEDLDFELTPMGPSLNLLGPVSDAPYVELAATGSNTRRCSYGLLFNDYRLTCDYALHT